jgi:predicted regulator of Ras-like GTPase activity (Roadblock/LC7/MglB family)
VITWSGGSYTIPQGTVIQPGQFLAFDVGSIPSSDTVTLLDTKSKQIDQTTFSSVPTGQGWGRYPDGEDSWDYTTPTKAAPNQPASPPPPSNVVINEVYPDTNGWVELYNTDAAGKPTEIGGWVITWGEGTYTIPQNTKIKPGEFLAFDVGNISSTDTVILEDDTGAQQDSTSFSSIPTSYGWGRYPDGTSNWWITIPTKGGANSIPEFSDAIVPLAFTLFMFGVVKYRKNKRKNSKRKVKKMNELEIRNKATTTFGTDNNELREIVSKLLTISDVDGAGIVMMDGSVISWQMNHIAEPREYVDFMLDFLTYSNENNVGDYKQGMFIQKIVDYNGHKILISKIKTDLMLMLLLDKKAYLGLTMLDIEGFLREIDHVLNKGCS